VCRKLLLCESALRTFAAIAGVPPHNIAAERALAGVLRGQAQQTTKSVTPRQIAHI
jgi:hypothetical protein